MNSIAVIILTYNEEKHILRCVENAKRVSNEIYIIDSYSKDNTVSIAKSLGVNVVSRNWPGNQASQFNWALDNLKINSNWILRLDADEYLLDELVVEINENISKLDNDTNGVIFNRRLIFKDKWIRRGAYPNPFLRLFRKGFARSEERVMDEHIVLDNGNSLVFKNDFVDHNLMDMDTWLLKHIDYSNREVQEHFKALYITNNSNISTSKKAIYNKLPLFLRAIIYFIVRYFFRGGIFEGRESFIWNFFQGLWYRLLIDTKIWEVQRKYSKEEIISILKSEKEF